MPQAKKQAENLGEVLIQNGQQVAEMVRECDPDGKIVAHPIRKSAYVHERLHAASKLPDELFGAAEKFRLDFERAQLAGNYARLDLFKTRSGKQDISDNVVAAKLRISKCLGALSAGRDDISFSQSCMWNVVGLGMTLENWTIFVRSTGKAMNTDKAAGIMHSSLERLALHYGMIDVGKMAVIGQDKAYGRGVKDTVDFLAVFSTSAVGGEKNVVGRLLTAMQKRFKKFI